MTNNPSCLKVSQLWWTNNHNLMLNLSHMCNNLVIHQLKEHLHTLFKLVQMVSHCNNQWVPMVNLSSTWWLLHSNLKLSCLSSNTAVIQLTRKFGQNIQLRLPAILVERWEWHTLMKKKAHLHGSSAFFAVFSDFGLDVAASHSAFQRSTIRNTNARIVTLLLD